MHTPILRPQKRKWIDWRRSSKRRFYYFRTTFESENVRGYKNIWKIIPITKTPPALQIQDMAAYGKLREDSQKLYTILYTKQHTSDDYKEDTGGMQVVFKFLMHEYYSHDMSKKSKSAKRSKCSNARKRSSGNKCCNSDGAMDGMANDPRDGEFGHESVDGGEDGRPAELGKFGTGKPNELAHDIIPI